MRSFPTLYNQGAFQAHNIRAFLRVYLAYRDIVCLYRFLITQRALALCVVYIGVVIEKQFQNVTDTGFTDFRAVNIAV